MTAKEQEASHETLWQAYQAKYAAWLDKTLAKGIDLRNLERVELNILSEGAAPTLSAALDAADEVVIGRVEKVTFQTGAITTVQFRVDRAVKGNPGSEVLIMQPGGLEPANLDWTGVVLSESIAQPLLLPGDEAMLFLTGRAGARSIQSFSGFWRMRNGAVQGLKDNPASWRLNGLPLQAAVDEILKEVD